MLAMHIAEALKKFVTQLNADGRSVHTVKSYQRHVAALERWLAIEGHDGHVEHIDHEMLARFLTAPAARSRPDGTPKKANSLNGLRTSLRCVFAYLTAAGILAINPARLVRRARVGAPLPRAPSESDQRKLLDTLATAVNPEAARDRALVHLLLGAGLRLASAIALNVEDVDLDQGEVLLRAAKGNVQQQVFLSAELRELIAKFVSGRSKGPVFANRLGQRVSPRHIQRRLAGWCAQAGIARRISPHSLRHAFAMRLYQSVKDVLVVRDALGHKSIASTLVYARRDAGAAALAR